MTFSDAIASRAQPWSVMVTIEGIGDHLGQYYFCTQLPAFAGTQHKDWLVDFPALCSERVDPLGGVPESGEIEARILDHADSMTGWLRLDKQQVTLLDADITTASTTLTVKQTKNFTTNDIIYIRNEAMLITAIPNGTTLTVTRSVLDTDVRAHSSGSAIYDSIPYVRGRRIRVYAAPADSTSTVTEELGTYSIDSVEMSDDLNSYVIRGATRMRYLDRVICGQVGKWEIAQWVPDANVFWPTPKDGTTQAAYLASYSLWPDEDTWWLLDEEIVRADYANNGWVLQARGQCGTEVADEHKPKETARLMMVSDGTYGDFRYSPAPSPSEARGTPTWIASDSGQGAHWVDILLCLLTSSARENDGLELVNYDENEGNWSCLPSGYGIGMPISLIDVRSFIDVKARTPNFVFPRYAIGDKPESFAEHVTEKFLKPIGAYFVTVSGKLKLVLPRVPMVGELAPTWTLDDIRPDSLSAKMVMRDGVASSVIFKMKNELGQDVSEVVSNADLADLFGTGSFYAAEEDPIEVELPHAAAMGASSPFLRALAMRKLFRFSRPQWDIEFQTDLAQYSYNVGDLVALTLPELPDFSTGTRGWISVLCEVLEKSPSIQPEFCGIKWRLRGYGPGVRVGRIPPSANITGVSGTGPYVCTVSANRHTQSDTRSPLPETDASAFTVDDVVRIRNRDGTSSTSTTQTISAIGTNTITVSGNFSGNLASGKILVYADRDAAASQQHTRYVYWADRTDQDVGSSTDAPWTYGEP